MNPYYIELLIFIAFQLKWDADTWRGTLYDLWLYIQSSDPKKKKPAVIKEEAETLNKQL